MDKNTSNNNFYTARDTNTTNLRKVQGEINKVEESMKKYREEGRSIPPELHSSLNRLYTQMSQHYEVAKVYGMPAWYLD